MNHKINQTVTTALTALMLLGGCSEAEEKAELPKEQEEVTELSETSEEENELVAESAESEEEEGSGRYEIKGQTYYNKEFGFQLTAPDDWFVEPEDKLSLGSDNLLFLAHGEGMEYVDILKIEDCDAETLSQNMKNPDALCDEILRQSPKLDSCEVDTIEINGAEHALVVVHNLDGDYSGWIYYGEKDGMYNFMITVNSKEKETIKEILNTAISEYESD